VGTWITRNKGNKDKAAPNASDQAMVQMNTITIKMIFFDFRTWSPSKLCMYMGHGWGSGMIG